MLHSNTNTSDFTLWWWCGFINRIHKIICYFENLKFDSKQIIEAVTTNVYRFQIGTAIKKINDSPDHATLL